MPSLCLVASFLVHVSSIKVCEHAKGQEIDQGLEKGLEWLAKQQNKDGSFGPARDSKGGSGSKLGATWVDSLCTMLFVLHAQEKGSKFKDTADRAAKFISQAAFSPKEMGHGGTDTFALVYYTVGLAKVCAKTKDEKLLAKLKEYVGKIVPLQKDVGGWNYSKDNTQNTVFTATALYAIALAKELGVDVPDKVFEKGRDGLKALFDKETRGFKYGSAGEGGRVTKDYERSPNVARSGSAIGALMLIGEGSDQVKAGLKFLAKQFEGEPFFDYNGEPNQKGGLPFHATAPLGYFHGALALALGEGKTTYTKLTERLLKLQKGDGSFQIGDEFLDKIPLYQLEYRRDLARVRDTCLALLALGASKDVFFLEEQSIIKKISGSK